jgi:N-acylneuraminate cytidylyltransferase
MKVAFIPARSGSKRIKNKNIYRINNHPLLAYAISSAINSKLFDKIICATDSEEYAEIARYYGAEVPFLRDNEISGDLSPDIQWVKQMLNWYANKNQNINLFAILRPTSPFRKSTNIIEAFDLFKKNIGADSLRAVEKVKQHPGKMWVINKNLMNPLMPFSINDTPWHSNQTSILPDIFVQNASLEFSYAKNVFVNGSISGEIIIPYFSNSIEGFDINNPEDIILLEHFVKNDINLLEQINLKPFKKN